MIGWVENRYLMIRYSNDTILFDERFINYGCNKVQYVDYLRHLGYQFYILGDEFAMDVLHPDSSHRTHFLDYRKRTQKPEMTIVCYDYPRSSRSFISCDFCCFAPLLYASGSIIYSNEVQFACLFGTTGVESKKQNWDILCIKWPNSCVYQKNCLSIELSSLSLRLLKLVNIFCSNVTDEFFEYK